MAIRRRARIPGPPSNERAARRVALERAQPRRDGRHPRFAHLYWFDIEPHYGSYLLTTAARDGSILMREDDLIYALGNDGDEIPDGAWLSDEYLNLLEEE
jgi:hypothetical protein